MTKRIVFILLFSCAFIVFIYFHPTKETMICNEQYECSITHDYFWLIHTHDKLHLSNKTLLWHKITTYVGLHGTWFHSYLEYDGVSPFIYFWNHQDRQRDIDYVFNIEQKRFNNYLLNPNIGYKISSEAKNSIWMYLVALIALLPLFKGIL